MINVSAKSTGSACWLINEVYISGEFRKGTWVLGAN